MTQNTKCKYIHFGYTCLIDNICSSCRTDAHYAPKPKKIKIKFIKKKQVDCDEWKGRCGCYCSKCWEFTNQGTYEEWLDKFNQRVVVSTVVI